MKPFSDSLDEGERGSFCLLLRSYAVVCQFRTITLVSIVDDCRRLKRTVSLELIALHCVDAIVNNSGCELAWRWGKLTSFANEIDAVVIVTSAMNRGGYA